jgi:23S rRNA pseudouridine2605 synthase
MKQNKPLKAQKTRRIRSKVKAIQRVNRQAPDQKATGSAERINRYLAHCGLCSRREADRWIEAGRVSLNGKPIKQPGVTVQAEDVVCVDGKNVFPQTSFTYILYNKPKGQLCSRRDTRGRSLIYDHLEVAPNVQSIGRLDMDTEGLLLLTDDGTLTRELTHPGARLPREYRARVAGNISLETMEILRRGGMDIGEGDVSDPWEITVDSETRGHTWITIIITRGRWREIRRTLEVSGHPVRRLIRTRFGPIRLEEGMPHGSWRKLNRAEVKKLKQFLQRQP